MIKILFICHGSILKSPGKARKINGLHHEAERRLLHHYYTIFERALEWQNGKRLKAFDNFVEIYNILGYIANWVDIVCPICLRKYISIDFLRYVTI